MTSLDPPFPAQLIQGPGPPDNSDESGSGCLRKLRLPDHTLLNSLKEGGEVGKERVLATSQSLIRTTHQHLHIKILS